MLSETQQERYSETHKFAGIVHVPGNSLLPLSAVSRGIEVKSRSEIGCRGRDVDHTSLFAVRRGRLQGGEQQLCEEPMTDDIRSELHVVAVGSA